jgi:hypothetical protein
MLFQMLCKMETHIGTRLNCSSNKLIEFIEKRVGKSGKRNRFCRLGHKHWNLLFTNSAQQVQGLSIDACITIDCMLVGKVSKKAFDMHSHSLRRFR